MITINMLYVVTSKEIGLQVNAEIFSCLVNRLYDKITFFESVAKLKNLRTKAHQHCIYEEIMNRLNSFNACYHSVQSLVFPFPI